MHSAWMIVEKNKMNMSDKVHHKFAVSIAFV